MGRWCATLQTTKIWSIFYSTCLESMVEKPEYSLQFACLDMKPTRITHYHTKTKWSEAGFMLIPSHLRANLHADIRSWPWNPTHMFYGSLPKFWWTGFLHHFPSSPFFGGPTRPKCFFKSSLYSGTPESRHYILSLLSNDLSPQTLKKSPTKFREPTRSAHAWMSMFTSKKARKRNFHPKTKLLISSWHGKVHRTSASVRWCQACTVTHTALRTAWTDRWTSCMIPLDRAAQQTITAWQKPVPQCTMVQ